MILPTNLITENLLQCLQRFSREALIWRQLEHSNILPFLGLDKETFRRDEHVCMVSPWTPYGNLQAFYNSEHYSAPRDCLRLVLDISYLSLYIPLTATLYPQLTGAARGLCYLHNQDVLHGDIKDVRVVTLVY
jgi:serine/threonine protein kinase